MNVRILAWLPEQQDAHFVMIEPVNTGLDDDTEHTDGGVGDITLSPRDMGHFKSPSLRNVEVTSPYMHDGRFATLEAVVMPIPTARSMRKRSARSR